MKLIHLSHLRESSSQDANVVNDRNVGTQGLEPAQNEAITKGRSQSSQSSKANELILKSTTSFGQTSLTITQLAMTYLAKPSHIKTLKTKNILFSSIILNGATTTPWCWKHQKRTFLSFAWLKLTGSRMEHSCTTKQKHRKFHKPKIKMQWRVFSDRLRTQRGYATEEDRHYQARDR